MGIYRRTGARGTLWYIRYWTGGVERREAAGPTRQHAKDMLARRQVEIAERRFGPAGAAPAASRRTKVAELAERWMKHAKATKRSWRRDQVSLVHLVGHLGQMPVTALVPLDIERYKRTRLAEKYTVQTRGADGRLHPVPRETKPGTINRELTLLRTMLRQAVRDGLIHRNPFDGVKLMREPPGRVTRLSPADEERLLGACGPRLRAVVTVALHTGMRLGEILALRRRDVDLDAGLLSIEQSKSGRRRDLPLNAAAHAALAAARGRLGADAGPDDLVFGTRTGLPYRSLERPWRAALAKAGVKGFRFHDLRHAFASRLVEGGTDLLTVAQLLGHSSLAMVQRYAHLSPQHRREAVDRLVRPDKKPDPAAGDVAEVFNITAGSSGGRPLF
jgi:integrase